MSSLIAPHSFYISTSQESQDIDARTIQEFGIESFTLMEVAGYSAFRDLIQRLQPKSHGLFFCGKGNNAGDALVVARYLLQHGFDITAVFISGTDDLSEDTRKNFQLLKRIKEANSSIGSLTIISSWNEFDLHTEADFVIDGMLGTGLDSEVRGDYNKAITWSNKEELPVYAMDIPTGLHGDTGKVMGNAISADLTYSFGTLKQGLYLNDGPGKAGEVIYCELPFPNHLKDICSAYLLDDQYVLAEPDRSPRHKYEAGVLYVVAGSEGLTGAAMLAAQSAWAEGIGAVILVCPHGNLPIYEKALPQIIKKPIGERDDYFFKEEHTEEVIATISEKKGKVLIGPGLGRNDSTIGFVQQLLETNEGDMLLDADGLWCLAQLKEWNKPKASTWILTPHPGELSNLLGRSIEDDHDRLESVKTLSTEKNVNILSKGYPVILGTPEAKAYLTSYDTRKFSRAGFGDVLAGKIGAFWSRDNSAAKSSALALLKGKHILENLLKADSSRIVEPKDFI
ncbi:NAD(P)H-hydrate dehydratase [Balneolaceae bacterium YR4-1]|uniref:Bifunctional NAD(P)H-hydrate repair enzyme n=1 Tax=Halalkalibaculum roseum TaxID=2709311 RepID=A0A6M1T173_9BACT|nr:NAD(P)H-hydrate dehydratase [Halalkalibaculum roseum]NGP77314.1 NAD(P)H-hydrate dehydratase [Halalkalibaculum roseum]